MIKYYCDNCEKEIEGLGPGYNLTIKKKYFDNNNDKEKSDLNNFTLLATALTFMPDETNALLCEQCYNRIVEKLVEKSL